MERTVFLKADPGYPALRMMVREDRPDVVVEPRVERRLFITPSYARWAAVRKSLTGLEPGQLLTE